MKPTKKQKLEWIRKARILAHKVNKKTRPIHTCYKFKEAGDAEAKKWYSNVSIKALNGQGYLMYTHFMFEYESYTDLLPRNNAGLLWLAMLETLVLDNQF